MPGSTSGIRAGSGGNRGSAKTLRTSFCSCGDSRNLFHYLISHWAPQAPPIEIPYGWRHRCALNRAGKPTPTCSKHVQAPIIERPSRRRRNPSIVLTPGAGGGLATRPGAGDLVLEEARNTPTGSNVCGMSGARSGPPWRPHLGVSLEEMNSDGQAVPTTLACRSSPAASSAAIRQAS